MSEYDDTNRGALFPAEDQKIIRSGPVNIDGSQEHCAIVQTKTKSGKTIFEFYQKIGAIFPNEKRNENDADMSGNLETKYGPMKVWGRKKQSKNGNDYTAISLAPPLNAPSQSPMGADAVGQVPSSRVADDEIPF